MMEHSRRVDRFTLTSAAGLTIRKADAVPPQESAGAIETGLERSEDKVELAGTIRSAREQIDRLNARERDVLLGLIDGKANKTIAHELDISTRTVEVHRASLMDKLGVRSVAETVRVAFAAGLVQGMPLR